MSRDQICDKPPANKLWRH